MVKLNRSYLIWVGIAIAVGVAIFIKNSPALFAPAGTKNQTTTSTVPLARYESKVDYEQAIIDSVDQVSPAIVSITISKNVPIIENCAVNPLGDLPPEFQQFFGNNNFQFSQPCQKGTRMQDVGGGSGFIVSPD